MKEAVLLMQLFKSLHIGLFNICLFNTIIICNFDSFKNLNLLILLKEFAKPTQKIGFQSDMTKRCLW